MRSLILTALYLAKDTLHRWASRISSPLARVLVVYFLSLCALGALGSFAISVKIVKDRITRQGGDLVAVFMSTDSEYSCNVPTDQELSTLLDVDSYALYSIGSATADKRAHVPVYTFDFRRYAQFRPLLAPGGGPTLLVKEEPGAIPAGPGTVTMGRADMDVFVRHLPADHLLMRVMDGRGILVPPDAIPQSASQGGMKMCRVIMRIRNLENADSVMRVERYFGNLTRLEGYAGSITSASSLLAELDTVLGKQTQCRLGFCVGITCIVGILLTALAGMEYRQNEYIYTLMKSFGIHPIMLVGAFVVENCLIVGLSFLAALGTFMHFQDVLLREILKMPGHALTLDEIMPEIQIISLTLGVCVLASSLPIVVAANRAIGRVLK